MSELNADLRTLPKIPANVQPRVELLRPPAGKYASIDRAPDAPAAAPAAPMPAATVNVAGVRLQQWRCRLAARHGRRRRARTTTSRRSTRRSGSSARPTAHAGGVHVQHALVGAGTGTPCDNQQRRRPDGRLRPARRPLDRRRLRLVEQRRHGPYYECIAVSKTSDPVTGGWYLYAVRADDASHPWFPDYPKMGIWPDGLYMTANMFADGRAARFQEVRVWAFNRADLEVGRTLRSVVVDLNTTTLLQPAAEQPARRRRRPPGGPNFLVGESQTAFAFQVFKFHVDYSGSGSTFTGPTNVSQTAYTSRPATVPSPAQQPRHAARAADDAGAVPQPRRHRVALGQPHRPDVVDRADRDPVGADQRHRRHGRDDAGAAADLRQRRQRRAHRWMGSLAVDKDGNMALGYSVSERDASTPTSATPGRLAGDPLNTLPQGETTMLPGSAARRPATAAAAPAPLGRLQRDDGRPATAAPSGTRTSTTRPPG